MPLNDNKKSNITTFIFVYGTLKKGYRNHHIIENNHFVGAGLLESGYALDNFTRPFPYLFECPNLDARVQGEIYKVDYATLHNLDILERVAENHYQRIEVAVEIKKDTIKTMWTYLAHPDTQIDKSKPQVIWLPT